MAKYRLDRLNEEIKKELSLMIGGLKDPRIPPIVTVTAVKVTNDLSHAKVYVSAMDADIKEVLAGLKSSSGFLRRELAARLTVHKMPELHFEHDESYARGMRIYAILDDIKREERGKETAEKKEENTEDEN